jgi:capsular exopolysaccharide synthesis family protein
MPSTQLEERNNKLMTADDAAAQLDMLRRDYGYGRGGAHEPEETHLRDYWRIIRRRLWVPIAVTVLAVTLTTIYNLRLPSIYEGVTRIEIASKDRIVNLKDVQLNLGGGDDSAYQATQLKILESPKIAYRIAKALELDRDSKFMPGGKPRQTTQLAVSEDDANERAEMERLEGQMGMLLGNVKFVPVRDTRLVDIRFRHTDPEIARKVADKWAEVFVDNDMLDRQQANRKSANFLDKNIAEYKTKLRQAEERLLNYTSDHRVLPAGGENSNTVQARLAALNQLLISAEQERKTAQTAYDISRTVKDPTTIPEIQRDSLVQDLTRRLTELKQNREKLLVEYTEEWPDVKKVNQEIAQIEGELRAAHQRILSTIQNLYQSAVQKETSLRSAFKDQERETLKQSKDSIVAKMLQQEVDANRSMLEKLQTSQKEVEVSAAGLVTTNIFIRNNSPLPRSPVGPNRAQNILISLVLGLLGGVGLVLFLDYINNKIDSVEDIDRYLRLPALGVIPVVEAPKARKSLTSGEESDSRELAIINNGNSNGSVILTQVESNSSVAESYRQLRTSLLLSSAGHAPRTLLVTSSQPAEGKTTTSVNTAISLAQTGAAVLIVDADLRRPRVHKIFNLKNNAGLCNYLAGDCDLASLIQIAMPNLYVLPVGPLPPNPAELLGSTKMKNVVDTLAANFDYVVIDSPPVSSFADSLILSALVEGVIIVVRSGFTPREMAQRTKAHLQSVGAKILGVVINQIKLQPHDYYYYSSYYSRYYYGGGDREKESASGAD